MPVSPFLVQFLTSTSTVSDQVWSFVHLNYRLLRGRLIDIRYSKLDKYYMVIFVSVYFNEKAKNVKKPNTFYVWYFDEGHVVVGSGMVL